MGLHGHHVPFLMGKYQLLGGRPVFIHAGQQRAVGLTERRPFLIHVVQLRVRASPAHHFLPAVAGYALCRPVPVHNGSIRLHDIHTIGQRRNQLEEIIFTYCQKSILLIFMHHEPSDRQLRSVTGSKIFETFRAFSPRRKKSLL